MTRSIDSMVAGPIRHLSLAVLLAGSVLAAGCGTTGKRPPQAQESDETAPAAAEKGDPQARFAQALDALNQNQIDEAEQALLALTRDFPDYTGPWTNLGILYAKSNRRDEALRAFQQAVAVNPKNDVAWNWTGILRRERGDLNGAKAAYDQALALNPRSALAHFNLGLLYDAHFNRPADALPHYRAYLDIKGEEDLRVLAWIAAIEARSTAQAPAPAAATETGQESGQ